MLKAPKDSIEELGEKMIVNAGGGLLTAVIDDYYYYDENLEKKKFEDGHTYFPSVLVSALHMSDDLKGESLFYQDREENDQLKKEATNTHALKKSVKNPSVSVVTDTSGVVDTQGKYLKEDGTYESTTGPYPRTIPTLADTPIEPQSVEAREIADALCDTVCDALYDAASKDIPKELLK